MILALAGLSQVDISDQIDSFDLEFEQKYPTDQKRANFEPEEDIYEFIGNNGGEAANITVIVDRPNFGDDCLVLHELVPKCKFNFPTAIVPLELLSTLLSIEDADGQQVIVLPAQPKIMVKPLAQIYSRLLERAIGHLVVEKGFTVVAPAPSEPGVYTASLPMLLTYAPYRRISPISADLYLPYIVSHASMGLYAAATIACVKQGLMNSGRSSIPSNGELRKLFNRTNVDPESIKCSILGFLASDAHWLE